MLPVGYSYNWWTVFNPNESFEVVEDTVLYI